jgi:putative hydrolase of the HAD superfamily
VKPRIKGVVFDAVGTLIYPNPGVAEAYAAHGARHGSRRGVAEVLAAFRQAFLRQEEWDRQSGGLVTSEAREHKRWRAIVSDTFPDVVDPEPLFDSLWGHFALGRNWALFDDVAACWERLEALGLKLAVASNFDSRLNRICAELPPLNRAAVFVSSELGWRKPARPFFDAIAGQLALASEELLMVGDDLENDYQAARAAGWQAVLLDRCLIQPGARRISRLIDLPGRLVGQN